MKKILYLTTACLMLSACGNFNDKQPVDASYYKNTQSVAWPTAQKKAPVKKAQPKPQKATTISKTVSTTTTTSETTTYTK